MDNTTIKQVISNFVTGNLVTYFKVTNQKIDDEYFDKFQARCVETAFAHIFRDKKLDASCSDFECTVSQKAKELYNTLFAKQSVPDQISGADMSDPDFSGEGGKATTVPKLKERTMVSVGDFQICTDGSGEMFIQTSPTQDYRCKVDDGHLVVVSRGAQPVYYGGWLGIKLL